MKNSADRIMSGIIETLRSDVLPHVSEAYARGQVLAAVDLLRNLAPMLEPARGPLLARIRARRDTINEICRLMPELTPRTPPAGDHALAELVSAAGLLDEQQRLDDMLADMVDGLFDDQVRPGANADINATRAYYRTFIREQASYEMAQIQKPLFGEIAKGKDKSSDAK